jgi:hypothetical protein
VTIPPTGCTERPGWGLFTGAGKVLTFWQDYAKADEIQGTAWDWLFLAMAHASSKESQRATKRLGQAKEWIDTHFEKRATMPADAEFFWNRTELRLLRAEAERLLKQ